MLVTVFVSVPDVRLGLGLLQFGTSCYRNTDIHILNLIFESVLVLNNNNNKKQHLFSFCINSIHV